jgi:hypothetical protein
MTAPDPQIRIGYAERAAAQEALDVHLTAGRLDADEYADRFATAGLAHTQTELDALFVDLPEPHPARAEAPRPASAVNRGSWTHYLPTSTVGRLVALVLVTALTIAVLPFALAAALLYFVVVPRLMCGARWTARPPMWGPPGHRRE